MILAAYRDTGYKIVLLVHIIAVVMSLAPAVAHPVMMALEKRRDEPDLVGLGQRMGAASRIYLVALAIAGVVGFGLISMSSSVIAYGDTWVVVSVVLWLALNGILHAVVFPAERALGAGDLAAADRLDKIGPAIGLMVLVLLYLMVVKPGAGGL